MRKSHVSRENLISQEKISCLKRKSHVLSVLGPPPQRENLLSLVSWENHMSQEKISCLISFWSPLNKKISCLLSHDKISCSKRKPHVFLVLGPPNEKISCLLSHEKISCLKRKSHVLSVLAPPMRKSPVSCLMRKSHVLIENILSPVSKEILLSDEKFSCLMLSS